MRRYTKNKPLLPTLPKDAKFRKAMKMFREAGGIAVYNFAPYNPDYPKLQHTFPLTDGDYQLDYENWRRDCKLVEDKLDAERSEALAKVAEGFR